jgi:hypothetical protein
MLSLDNVCSTVACAAFGRVCPPAAYAVCGPVCPTAAFTASGRICAKTDFAAWMCLQYSIAALCCLLDSSGQQTCAAPGRVSSTTA